MTTTLKHFDCHIPSIKTITNALIHDSFFRLFEQSKLDGSIVNAYATWLDTKEPALKEALISYFSAPEQATFTPVFIYHEGAETLVTILADQKNTPYEPGETGSILAYVRYSEYDDKLLCSDCFGQLSCSSCAVEVLAGTPENPTPRDEEYDMLDIDKDRPPTQYTRLGCQTVVGKEALVLKVRK